MSAVVIFTTVRRDSVAMTSVDFDTVYDAEEAANQWLVGMRQLDIELNFSAIVLDKGDDD